MTQKLAELRSDDLYLLRVSSMTPLQARPERQKSLGAKNIEGLDINLIDYVAFLICHSSPNKDPYSAQQKL